MPPCVCNSHGLVSVLQVGIVFLVYRSVFTQVGSVFDVGFSKYRDIGRYFRYFTLRLSTTCGS